MATRVISIVGRKNAGKTTLTVALVSELTRRKLTVMTLKHGHHPVDADRKGTDTWRHFHEGGAVRTMIAGPSMRVLFERAPDDYDPLALVRRHLADADIVVIEGYKRAPIPKIEVVRPDVGPPLLDPDAPDASLWVCCVTDSRTFQAPCPVLHFNDTMWMQLLAEYALQGALPVT